LQHFYPSGLLRKPEWKLASLKEFHEKCKRLWKLPLQQRGRKALHQTNNSGNFKTAVTM